MIKNKHGQFYAVILFFLVLFMCFLSVTLSWNQQNKMQNSIVSPFVLLNLEDEEEIFELHEERLIKEVVCDKGDLGTVEIYNFLITRVFASVEIKEFLMKELQKDGDENSNQKMIKKFYRVRKEGKIVTVDRIARKDFEILPIEDGKNSFSVGVEWVFKRTYKINLDTDCKKK